MNKDTGYKPIDADAALEIAFYLDSKFKSEFMNALNAVDKEIFENTDETKGPIFDFEDSIGTFRWHSDELSLTPESILKAVKSLPTDGWLLHVCPQYGLDGGCQSLGGLVVPDGRFEYEFYFECDEDPEIATFDENDAELPMNVIAWALSSEDDLIENLSDETREQLDVHEAFKLSDDGEIAIYCNVPAGKNSLSGKLEQAFRKLDPESYVLFIIPQTGFIDEWSFGNTFPGEMKVKILGELEELPFDFSLRQYC